MIRLVRITCERPDGFDKSIEPVFLIILRHLLIILRSMAPFKWRNITVGLSSFFYVESKSFCKASLRIL